MAISGDSNAAKGQDRAWRLHSTAPPATRCMHLNNQITTYQTAQSGSPSVCPVTYQRSCWTLGGMGWRAESAG